MRQRYNEARVQCEHGIAICKSSGNWHIKPDLFDVENIVLYNTVLIVLLEYMTILLEYIDLSKHSPH